jgi:enamine deaminase RidA (YjgF/YER057c/UK114 family)
MWSEKHLRAATRAAGVALWSWNVDSDAITMDQRAYELWDVSEDEPNITFEILSRNIHPADLERVRTTLPSAGPQTPASPHMEIIHHPNYDTTVFMPFVPGIKIKSGKILWLAGTTALPVYHDHPHKREQIQQYMTGNLEEQTKRTMDGIKQTLDAAGASFKDVVHMFVFRARPQMGDIGRASRVINSYFAPFNHKPTSTNIAVLELGEPEQLIEIQMFAVVD